MKIPWIKCSERMPPDDDNYCIAMVGNDTVPSKVKGSLINSEIKKWGCNSHSVETYWIPYDESTWKEISNGM